MGEDVHVGHVHPHEEWRPSVVLPSNEIYARFGRLVVDGLHPLLIEWSGVLNPLLPLRTIVRIGFAAILFGRPAMQHAAGVCQRV